MEAAASLNSKMRGLALHVFNRQADVVNLYGLTAEVDLKMVRDAMLNGTIQPFSDAKVKDELTEIARLLHGHLTLIPGYRKRVCGIQPTFCASLTL